MDYLFERLQEYSASGYYGFHMPGHKRNTAVLNSELPYQFDITEIEGFDDLHHADGILREAQDRAAHLFSAEETHYLINGSTVGLLSAVLGCTDRGDRILMARNCHKSVYHAVLLNELRPVYLYPEIRMNNGISGKINPASVSALLEKYKDISAVIITSPTYDGIVSDIEKIAEITHREGIPLIVDEAHGAHFGFHPYFPQNSNQLGADIVIHSVHKTLPSLTQTALLHMNGSYVRRDRVRKYLHMLQSSSPSYILMASIDECVRFLENDGEKLFCEFAIKLKDARERLRDLKNLYLFEMEGSDPSKIVLATDRIEINKCTGKEIYHYFNRKYLLQMEMCAPFYVLAMTSVLDTEAGLKRLTDAALEIDGKLANISLEEYSDSNTRKHVKNTEIDYKINLDDKVYRFQELKCQNIPIYSPWEADQLSGEQKNGSRSKKSIVPMQAAEGRIALEYAYLYPPGIPMIVPGERISSDTVKCLGIYKACGFRIEGTRERERIEVLSDG